MKTFLTRFAPDLNLSEKYAAKNANEIKSKDEIAYRAGTANSEASPGIAAFPWIRMKPSRIPLRVAPKHAPRNASTAQLPAAGKNDSPERKTVSASTVQPNARLEA